LNKRAAQELSRHVLSPQPALNLSRHEFSQFFARETRGDRYVHDRLTTRSNLGTASETLAEQFRHPAGQAFCQHRIIRFGFDVHSADP